MQQVSSLLSPRSGWYGGALAATLLLLVSACADTGGGSPTRSTGTPVNPNADPGGTNTRTAPLTGAQPRRY